MDENGTWNEDDCLSTAHEIRICFSIPSLSRLCEDLENAIDMLDQGKIEDVQGFLHYVYRYFSDNIDATLEEHFKKCGTKANPAQMTYNAVHEALYGKNGKDGPKTYDEFLERLFGKEGEDEK